jgi:predicted DNA-binding protein with PD1-like motif
MLKGSSSKIHVFRLLPHQDLKASILQFAKDRQIKAGIILTCVGSLEQYNLRFAHRVETTPGKGHFEIVSLTGTFSSSYGHFHICISDENGVTIGGHLMNDNLIYTTAEIAIAELTDFSFARVTDTTYGYSELKVENKNV